MEQAIKWFSRNHVAANFLMLIVLALGFSTWFKLRKEIFPETNFDAVLVNVPYPNATPDEVVTGVVIPIEEAIAEVEGIKRVTSNANRNVGSVTVEVQTGYETRSVMDDVKTRVDAIDNFADNAERPILEEIKAAPQILSLAISAEADEAALRAFAERVRDELLNHSPEAPTTLSDKIQTFLKGKPTIDKVELAAVREYELSIEVSEKTLRQYDLTLAQVADAVRSASLDLPSGSVKTKSGEVLVRAVGKRYRGREFENVVVRTLPNGANLLLGGIATIRDGFKDTELSSTFNGRRVALVNVFRVGEQDTLAVVNVVKDYLEQLEMPPGFEITIWNDTSVYLEGRLDLLKRNIGAGLLLVLLVLALFLRPSLAALVALGIPVSFAGGVWMMDGLGISINMISAFAFILVLGIVVDDAIVVGENVYTQIQAGKHPREASWEGTHEVGVVVIFGVLTTMAAFTPMLGLSGVSGKIWPNIPLVVIPVLFFSLLQSKFVLPAHLALLKPTSNQPSLNPIIRVQQRVAQGLEYFVKHIYTPFLGGCLRFRYVVLAVFLAMVVGALSLVATGWIPFIFLPKIEGEVLSAKVEMPLGAPFSDTERAVAQLAAAAEELGKKYSDREGNPVVVNILATAGQQPTETGFAVGSPPLATHLGEVTIELTEAKGRDVSGDELRVAWLELVGQIPGVASLGIRELTGAGGNAIDVNITGPDPEVLAAAADYATARLREDYAGTTEVYHSNRQGQEELVVRELTARGRALGFTLAGVMGQIRNAFYGFEVQEVQRGRDTVEIYVRYPEEERRSLNNLETMKLRTPAGAEVPLLEVIEPEYARGPATIKRIDRYQTISIQGDVDRAAGYVPNVIVKAFTEEVLIPIGEKFPGVKYSLEGEQSDQRDSVREMGIGFIGALFAMYVLMAIPLKSYTQPLLVMVVIPFGMVGAIGGHLLLGLELSIMSLCGVVALAGVVVNDSLVLVDYVNRHRKESPTVRKAALRAGARRFRPILLTSLTTFVGLMPMLLEQDQQARFLIPMAVSLGFGILFATAITLILLPALYLVMDDVRELPRRVKQLVWRKPGPTRGMGSSHPD